MKRTCSLFLVLAMLLGLLSGLTLTVGAASYSYNDGVREEVCTSLSSDALSYYTGSYTYDRLSSLSGSSLRTSLRSLITSNRSTVGYDGLKTKFPYTDAYQGSSSKLLLFYCNTTTTSNWDSAATWNREHMWPDSLGGSAMEGDLHAMRPTDPNVNSSRGNNKYGNVSGGKGCLSNDKNGNTLGGYYADKTFEPLDFAKGDCARVVLYDYVVASSMSSVTEVFTDVDTLLEWCKLDPVDTYEMSRNDVAQEIQGCRNPFVDYPELAWILLGESVPSDLVSPSGGGETYTVTATSSNTAYGTVSVSGRIITASPKTGYYASGYTVTKGTATVTQNGNEFVVTPESDCTVRINFAARQSVTVSFAGAANAITTYAGEAITLPSAENVDTYSFLGWSETTVSDTTAKPAYFKAGASYTPTESLTLYPLYTYTVGGSGGTGLWTLVESESQLKSGAQIVLAASSQEVTAGALSSSYLAKVETSFSSDSKTIPTLPASTLVLTLGGSDGAWTLSNAEGKQLGASKVKTLVWDGGTTTWDISIADGLATIANTSASYGRFLYNVSAPRFTTYASTTNTSTSMLLPQIYAMDGTGGTTYYTTEASSCAHSSVSYHSARAATCTAEGNIAYYSCASCGKYFSDRACTNLLTEQDIVIAAFGHSEGEYASNASEHWKLCAICGAACTDSEPHGWNDGVVTTQPTETQNGVRTYTCEACSYTRTESIPALGSKLTVSFSVPNGVSAVASLSAYANNTVTLPNAGTPDSGYSFLGWIAETVDNQTSVGSYYEAGEAFTVTGNVTLKALYSYKLSSGGVAPALTKMEAGNSLADGDKIVIVASGKGYGLRMETVSSSYVANFAFTGKLEDLTELDIVDVTASGDAWLLGNDTVGYLYNSSSNNLSVSTSNQTEWTLTDNGDGTFKLRGSRVLSCRTDLSGSNQNLWRMGGSGGTSGTVNLELYKYTQGAAVITYYTTEFASGEPIYDETIKFSHSLTLENDISINFIGQGSVLSSFDSFYLECTVPVYEGNEKIGTEIVNIEPSFNGTNYEFTLLGITAKMMNDEIEAVFRLTKDGKEYYSKTDVYSVAEYAYGKLDSTKATDTDELKAICANLLRYGALAQTQFNYRTDALVDANMTDAHKAYLTDLATVEMKDYRKQLNDLDTVIVPWKSTTLELGNKVIMCLIVNLENYTGDPAELTMRLTYVDSNGLTVTEERPLELYNPDAQTYAVSYDGLRATEMRSIVSAAIYSGETRVSKTVEYSIESYGARSSDTAMRELCLAMLAYGDAANAFFSK